MAQILRNIQEPGFFSEVKISPSLFVNPTQEQVVAIIGTGKDWKYQQIELVHDGTNKIDVLPSDMLGIKYIDSIISLDSFMGYSYLDYIPAVIGSDDVLVDNTIVGKEIKFSINGVSYTHTITLTNYTLDDLITQINTSQYISANKVGNKIFLYSKNNSEKIQFKILDGSANTYLKIANNSLPNSIYWISTNILGSTKYLVTYVTPKISSDFTAKFFYNLKDVIKEYGDDKFDNQSDPSLFNIFQFSLIRGAYGAFAGGSSVVACVQLDPVLWSVGDNSSKYTAIQNALKELEKYYISIIVPMDPVNTDITKVGLYLDHVSRMSKLIERKERFCILSTDETKGKMSISDWQNLMNVFNVPESSGLETKRFIVVHPGSSYTNYNGSDFQFDGTYAASIITGLMVNKDYDVATPMTKKVLPTITALFNNVEGEYSRIEKNTLNSKGVCVLEMKDGLCYIRRMISADVSSIASQEPSIIRSFDLVAKNLRESLEGQFVGQKIIPGVTIANIRTVLTTLLNEQVSNGIISSYRNIFVDQNSIEPRQIDISFEASPIYPLLWGLLEITITL